MPVKKKKKGSKKKSKQLLYRIIGIIFVALAIVIIVGFPKVPQKENKDPIQVSSDLYKNRSENIPTRILIPKVDIDLPVVEAKVVNGYWELSENSASHGEGSGFPGEKNNDVIFAHAREGLFYNLKDAKVGDIVYVFTKESWYRYKINKITSVYPNQIQVIKPTKNETLTLYTCTGFMDEKRLIVQATPESN
jgi:sortase A